MALPVTQAQINILALEARAASGDVEAQNALGNAYVNGQGVERDIVRAIGYYESAVMAGSGPAAFNLGLLHELGRGVELDLAKALGYYLRAAELGLPAAQFNVGNMYSRGIGTQIDPFQATIWFRRAADSGIADAQFNLGVAYETGQGVTADAEQAIHWYSQAMAQDFPRAAYNMALMYEEGAGVARDDAEAARLYQIAAEQNFGPAQNNLAVMYAEGRGGLTQNLSDAYPWFVLAAENGASPRGRDVVAARLDRIQKADADIKLAVLRNRLGIATPVAAAATSPGPRVGVPPTGPAAARDGQLSGRIAELENTLNQLRRENTGLISANQALAKQKSELEVRAVQTAPISGADRAELAHINTIAEELNNMVDVDPERRRLLAQAVSLLERISRDNLRLNADVKSATLELSSLSRRLRQTESELTALSRSTGAPGADPAAVVAAREREAQLEGQLADTQIRIQGLETGLAAVGNLRNQIQQLTAENEALANQLAAVDTTPAAPEIDPAELQQRDDQIAQLRTTTLEMEALQNRVADMTNALLAARDRIESAPSSDEVAALQQQVESLEGRVTERDDQIDNLRQNLAQQSSESASLAATVDQVSALTAELNAIRGQRETDEQALAAATAQLREWETRVERSETAAVTASVQVAQLESTVAERDAAVQSLRAELARQPEVRPAAPDDAALAELAAALDNETALRASLEQQFQAAQNEMAQLRDELTAVTTNAAELQAGVAERDAALEELRASLAAAQTQSAPTDDARLAQLEAARVAAESQLTQVRARLQSAETQMAESDEFLSSLAAENDQLRARLAEPGAESEIIADYQRVVSEQADRLFALTSARDRAVARATALSGQLRTLETELSSTSTVLTELATDNDTLRANLAMTRAEVGSNVAEGERLVAAEAARDVARTQVAELAAALDDTQSQLNENTSLVSTLSSEIDRLSADLAAASGDSDEALRNLTQTRDATLADLAQRDAALSQAETQLAQSNATISELAGQIDKLQTQLVTAAQAGPVADQSELIASLEAARDQALSEAEAMAAQYRTAATAIKENTASIDALSAELAAARTELANTSDALVAANQSTLVTQLGAARDEAIAESARLAQSLATAQTDLARNQSTINGLGARIGQLETALIDADQSAEVAQLATALDTARARSDQLAEELNQRESALTQSTAQTASLNARIATLESELVGADQSGDIDTLRARRDEAMAENVRLAEALESARADSQENQTAVSTLSAEIDRLQSALADADQSPALAQLEAERDSVQAELADTATALATALDEATDLDQRVAELAASLDTREAAYAAELAATVTARDAALGQARNIEQTLAATEFSVVELTAEIDRLQIQLTASDQSAVVERLNQELTAAREQFAARRTELDNTQSALATAETEAASLGVLVSELTATIDEVTTGKTTELTATIAARDSAAAKTAELELALATSRQQTATTESSVGELTIEINRLRTQLEQSDQSEIVAGLNRELATKQDRLAAQQAELIATANSLAAAQGEAAFLEATISELTGSLDTKDTAHATELAAAIADRDTAQNRAKNLERTLVATEFNVTDLSAEIDRLRTQLAASDQSAVVERLNQELTAAREQFAARRTEIDNAQSALADAQTETAALGALVSELTATLDEVATEQTTELTAAIAARDEAIGRTTQLESTLAATRQQASAAEASVVQLTADMAGLRNQLEASDQSDVLDQLNRELQTAQNERAALGDQLADRDAAVQTARNEAATLSDQISNLTAALDESTAGQAEALAMTIAARDAAETESRRLQLATTAAQDRATALAQDVAELAAVAEALDSVQSQLQSREATLADRETAVIELETRVAQLERELSEADQSGEIGKLITQRDRSLANVTRLTAEVATLQANLSLRNQSVAALQAQLEESPQVAMQRSAIESELTIARADSDQLRAVVAELESQLATAAESHAAQLAQLEATLDNDQSAVAAAQTEAAQFIATIAELETALAAATSAQKAETARVATLETTLRDAATAALQLDSVQAELMAAQAARDGAHAEVAQMQDQLASARDADGAAASELDIELNLARAQIGELEREIGNWRQLAATADTEAKTARSELGRMTAAHAAELGNFQMVTAVQLLALQENESAMAELRAALAQREQRITALAAAERSTGNRVIELESLVATSEDQLRDLTGLRRQLADSQSNLVETERQAQSQIGELANQVAVLEGQVNRDELALREARDRADQLASNLTAAQADVVALTESDAVATLTQQREAVRLELRQVGDQLIDARSDIAMRDARIFELERTINRARSSQDQLTDAVSELESYQQIVVRLEAELATVQQTTDRADQSDLIAALEEARDRAENRAEALQDEIAVISSQMVAQQQSNLEMQGELGALRAESERLRTNASGLASTRNQLAQLERQLDEAQNAAARSQGNSAEIEAARDQALNEVARLEAQLSDQQAALATQTDARESAQAELAKLQEQVVTAEQAAQQASREAQVSAAALVEATTRLERAETELAQKRAGSGEAASELTALAAERDTAREQADELAATMAQAQNALAARETETDGLRRQISDLETQVTAVRTEERANAQREIAALQEQLATTEQAVEQASREAQRSAAALAEATTRFERAETELAQKRVNSGDAAAELTALAAERDAAREQTDELAASMAQAQNALADRETETEALQQQISNLETGLAAAKERVIANDQTELVAQLQGRVGELQQALNDADQTEVVNELTAARDRLRSEVRALNDQGSDADRELAARDAQIADLAQRVETTGANTAQLADLRDQLQARQIGHEALQNELRATQQALAEADQSALVASLEQAREIARSEAAQLTEEIRGTQAALASNIETISSLSAENEQLRTSLIAADRTGDVARLEAARDQALTRSAELEEALAALNRTSDSRLARIVELEAELESSTTSVAGFEAARDSAAQAANQLSNELLAAQEALATREDQMAELNRQIDLLDADLAATQQAVIDADQSETLAALIAERDTAVAEISRQNASITELAQALDDRNAETVDLESELQRQVERLAEATAERDSTAREAQTLNNQIAGLQAELNVRDNRISTLESAVADSGRTTADLTQSRQALRQAEQSNRTLQTELTAALAAVTRSNDLLADQTALEAARDLAQTEVDRLNGELATAWESLDNNAAAIADLSGQNADLTERLSKSRAEVARQDQSALVSELQRELTAARSALADADQSATIAALENARDVADAQADGLRDELGMVDLALGRARANENRLQSELETARQQLAASAPAAEITALERARDSAVATAMELGNELTTAENALNENVAVIAELTGRNDRLQTELLQTERALTTAQTQGANRSELEALTRERDTAVAEAQRVAAEIERLQSTMDDNGGTITELTGANDRLQGDLAASERALAAALAAQAAAAEEAGMNPALNMEVNTLLNRVQQLEENIASERASAAREFSGLSRQLQRARETNQSLIEANRALLATRAADVETSDGSSAAFEREIADLTATTDSLRADNQALETALSEAQSAPRAPGDWEQRQRALTQRIETLESELTAAESLGDTVANLSAINDDLRTTQAQLENRLSNALSARGSSDVRTQQLSQRVAELESQLTIARGYESSVSQLANQVQDLRADNSALQTALNEARSAPRPTADWQQQREGMNRRIQNLESELIGAQALEATVNQLTLANQTLRQVQASLEQEVVEAAAARGDEANRTRALNRRVADLQQQLTAAQALQTRVDSLTTSRDDLRADNQALQTALAEARAAPRPPADWQQQRNALSSRVESLQTDLTTAQSYENTAAELMAANQALLASQGILEVRIADSDAAYRNAMARADALENRLADLNVLPDRLNAVEGELVTLQGDYDAVAREKDALAQQVAAAQAQAQRQQTQTQQAWADERTQLRSEIDRLRASATDLASRSDNDQSQLASLINEVTSARSRISSLEDELEATSATSTELASVSNRVRSTEQELNAQRVANSQLQRSLTTERRTHESRLAVMERENAALNTRLRQAQNTLDQIASAARVLNPAVTNLPSATRSRVNEAATSGGDMGERIHTVVEGDSLTRISLRYYGTPTRWQEIYQANRELLSEANALRPGQRLRIP